MREYFPEPKFFGRRVNVELNLSNYATKADLKNAKGIDTSDLAKKAALGNLKSDLDKLGIDELKNVSSNLKQFEM